MYDRRVRIAVLSPGLPTSPVAGPLGSFAVDTVHIGLDRETVMSSDVHVIRDLAEQEYKWGFVTQIEEERVPKGLNEDVIRLISAKKREPEFMLEWRLKAYRHWESLEKAQAEP